MISASSAFIAANNKLAKQPTWIVHLPGHIAYSSRSVSGNLYPNLGLGALLGAFTDGTGTVIQPIAIGKKSVSFKVPAGATQLQLGIDDDIHNDNSGGFTVDVSVNGGPASSVNVLGTSQPWNWVLGGLNNGYMFGWNNGTSPIVAASGLSAGNIVAISYQSGTVKWSPFNPFGFDADGDPSQITADTAGSSLSFFPTKYMIDPILPWLKSLDDLKITISDLAGGSDLSNLVFNVQDSGQQLTADMASFVFEGKDCFLLMGYAGMTVDQFVCLYTGVVDLVESDNGNIEYKFTVASKNQKRLSSVVYTTGDDGFATGSKHPRSILGHPLDILVSVMQQANIPLADIDTAKIYYYRDVIYSGLFYEFSLTTAPVARDFIQNELLKPMGMYLWEKNLGTMSINSFYPAISGAGAYTPPTPPIATLDVNDICVVPVEKQADLIDQVTYRFDENGSSFDSEIVQSWQAAIAKYGLYGAQFIESKGMRSSFQGYFMAAEISHIIFLRYGTKPIVLDPLTLFWRQCLLEPGDIIAITLAFVPDRTAGVMGVTTKAFEIMDRNWRFMSSAVELKLLEIDLSKFKQYLITPNAQPDYTADTALNQAKYMYQSNAAGKYSNGNPGNTLG